MSTGLLGRSCDLESLLSEQTYRSRNVRRSAPPITMEASQPLSMPFGEQGSIEFVDEPPKWIMPLLNQICRLGDLSFDWNSYGALPVDPEIAANAICMLLNVLSATDPLPAVVPTSRGGLMIEWHDRGIDLEIDFRSALSIDVSFEDGDHVEEFENAELELIRQKLSILRGRL